MTTKTYECYLINNGELMAKTSGYWRAQGSTVLLRSESGIGGRWKCRISYAAKWAKEAETAYIAVDDDRDENTLWLDLTR